MMPLDAYGVCFSLHRHEEVAITSAWDVTPTPIIFGNQRSRLAILSSFLNSQPGVHNHASSSSRMPTVRRNQGPGAIGSSFDDDDQDGQRCTPSLKLADQEVCPVGSKGMYVCDETANGFYHGGPSKFLDVNAGTGGCHTYLFLSKPPLMSNGSPCAPGTFCDGCHSVQRHQANPNFCEAHVWARGSSNNKDRELECHFLKDKCEFRQTQTRYQTFLKREQQKDEKEDELTEEERFDPSLLDSDKLMAAVAQDF